MKPEEKSNDDMNRDLGFGAVVARESRKRLLNRDGTFNVARAGLSPWSTINLYHILLTLPWWHFFGLVTVFYLAANSLFGVGYLLCGRGALVAPNGWMVENQFARAFFFSVHTMATIGYGNITPVGWAANLLVTFEALFGLLSVALITGILFARFSRPTARILFSHEAIIAPYRDFTAFEFRITNARRNQLINLAATIIYAQFEEAANGKPFRRFYQLPLERDSVVFFSLSWTVVHPIDKQSPLHGKSEQDILDANGEFLILLTGIDETFSQTVHARTSYKADEVIWRAKFKDIYNPPTSTGSLTIDVRKLDSIERLSGDEF